MMILVNSNADQSSVHEKKKKVSRDGHQTVEMHQNARLPLFSSSLRRPRTYHQHQTTQAQTLPSMPSHPAADAHPATSLLPISQHPPPCVWRHGSEANDDENTSPSTDMHTHCLQAQRRPTDIQLEHQNGTAQPSTHPPTLAHPPRLTPAGPNNPSKAPIENGRGYQPHPALPTRKDMRTHPPRPPPSPPRTPTVLAQQLHVPVAPGWNDADGADHSGRSTVLLSPRPRPRPWALCGLFPLLRRGDAADMARAARVRLTLPFSKEKRIAALQRPRARNLEIVKGVSARPGPGTPPLIRERENHCEPRGWRKWWARGELADQVADLLPSGGGGGAREHFRWEGEKGEGKEGVPKRLTVAYAPALPGKPQVFLLQERAARPNWT